jgi:integrase
MEQKKAFPIYRKRHASGNIGYRVDMGMLKGKRVYRHFPTEEKATAFQMKCREAEARNRPVELHDLSEIRRHEVLAALAKLDAHNANISTAVDYYLKHARPANAHARIGEVMNAFKAVKTKAGRSKKYLDTAWHSFFVPFRDHFNDCFVADITAEACEKYIYKARSWNATTRRTHLRHLSVLLNFAVQKGYCSLNPIQEVERPTRPASRSAEKVASVEEVIKLLQYAMANGYKAECAALVLIFFCGVRVDEVARLTWEKLKLDEDNPEVVLDETKANRRRVNRIPKNAIEWLSLLRGKGRIVPHNYTSRMKYLRKVSKVGLKQNAARISFASYHVALYKDAAKTAIILGHQNPALLWNTYRALVSKDDAKRYWKITPEYEGKDEVSGPTDAEVEEALYRSLAGAL